MIWSMSLEKTGTDKKLDFKCENKFCGKNKYCTRFLTTKKLKVKKVSPIRLGKDQPFCVYFIDNRKLIEK